MREKRVVLATEIGERCRERGESSGGKVEGDLKASVEDVKRET